MNSTILIHAAGVIGVAALVSLLAGCKGIPTKGEEEARHQAQAVAVGEDSIAIRRNRP